MTVDTSSLLKPNKSDDGGETLDKTDTTDGTEEANGENAMSKKR